MNGMGDTYGPVPGRTPCLQCLYLSRRRSGRAPPSPCWAPSPGAVGCLAAIEAIKMLTGFGKPLLGQMLVFDTECHEYRKYKLHRNPDCPVCSQFGQRRKEREPCWHPGERGALRRQRDKETRRQEERTAEAIVCCLLVSLSPCLLAFPPSYPHGLSWER